MKVLADITKSQYAGLKYNHKFIAESLDRFSRLLFGTLCSYEKKMTTENCYSEIKYFSRVFKSNINFIVNNAKTDIIWIGDKELRLFTSRLILELEEFFYIQMSYYQGQDKYFKLIWKKLDALKSNLTPRLRDLK